MLAMLSTNEGLEHQGQRPKRHTRQPDECISCFRARRNETLSGTKSSNIPRPKSLATERLLDTDWTRPTSDLTRSSENFRDCSTLIRFREKLKICEDLRSCDKGKLFSNGLGFKGSHW